MRSRPARVLSAGEQQKLALGRAWVLVASVIAVRQALDFTPGRAVGTFGVAALLMWLVVWGLSIVPLPT